MLPKRARNTRAELTELLKTGTRVHGRLFTYIYSKKGAIPAASVVVSKKVAATAVGRHKIRRRAYESLRATLPPFRLALIAKKEAHTASYDEVRSDITHFLSRTV